MIHIRFSAYEACLMLAETFTQQLHSAVKVNPNGFGCEASAVCDLRPGHPFNEPQRQGFTVGIRQ